MNRIVALVFILILTASSLIVVKPAHSSIAKPSVPEFTVELVDSSYDVPTTYSIDPYTGENVTYAGYHVERRSIEVKIKNQPFTPYYDESSGWNIQFYYNIRIKGHYSEDWIELYRASDGYPTQSDSQYTIISYVLGENEDTVLGTKMIEFPAYAQVDFQVEAMIGYTAAVPTVPCSVWKFFGETSGWSETQIISFPTPSPAPTPSLETPERANAILGLTILALVFGAVLLSIYFKERNKQGKPKQSQAQLSQWQ
jgi:hypothetical protein